jgi:hypothetical protein
VEVMSYLNFSWKLKLWVSWYFVKHQVMG